MHVASLLARDEASTMEHDDASPRRDRIFTSHDWIDCDVHFDLNAIYVSYLYGVARLVDKRNSEMPGNPAAE